MDRAVPAVWRSSTQGIDMTIDRASYPGVPDDFPVTAVPSAIGGAQPKMSLVEEDGKFYAPGTSPSEASLSRSCPRSLFEDTSGGQLLASHSASHVSPRLFLLGAALGRGNTARVDRPCQAQQMLRNLPA